MPLSVSRSGLASLVLLAAACGSGDTPPGTDAGTDTDTDSGTPVEDAGAEPTAELGTGDIEFEPIAEGSELQYVAGPQGGWHFFGSVRVTGIDPGNPDDRDDPDNPLTSFRVARASDDTEEASVVYQQGLDPAPGVPGTYEMVGRRIILDMADCTELEGVEVRFEVEVEDWGGVTVQDARTVTGTNAPINGCT